MLQPIDLDEADMPWDDPEYVKTVRVFYLAQVEKQYREDMALYRAYRTGAPGILRS